MCVYQFCTRMNVNIYFTRKEFIYKGFNSYSHLYSCVSQSCVSQRCVSQRCVSQQCECRAAVCCCCLPMDVEHSQPPSPLTLACCPRYQRKLSIIQCSLIDCETISAHSKWTVKQLSIMIIYNSKWSIFIQYIRFILSGDYLTWKTQKKDPFTRSKQIYHIGQSLKFWGTVQTNVTHADVIC